MTAALAIEGPGVLPAAARPATAAEAADAVREAAARGTRLRLVGAGTWLDAGHPGAADATLPLGGLRGVVDYVPGDLVLTARAGTPLRDVAAAARAEGQFLAVDPPGGDAGTLGATVATASAGPLAHALGTPRDVVLGAEFVTGRGDVVRAGGRVVKNVAGFDLVRLVTGAWGTLGAVTEVSVRLRALPEADATVAVALPPAARLGEFLARVREARLAAWALELVNAPLAEQLGMALGTSLGGGSGGARAAGVLLARVAGNAPLVAAQRQALAALGDAAEVDGDVWARLRGAEPRAAVVVRRSAPPTALAGLCAELFAPAAAAFGLRAHASVGRGVVRLILPGDRGFGLPRLDGAAGNGTTLVVERLPTGLWATLGARLAPGRARDPLSQRVRAAFDPAGVLNPGILGER